MERLTTDHFDWAFVFSFLRLLKGNAKVGLSIYLYKELGVDHTIYSSWEERPCSCSCLTVI